MWIYPEFVGIDEFVVCERVSPVYDVIRMKEEQFFEGKDHED